MISPSFRDAPTRQNSELFCAEGAGPESITPHEYWEKWIPGSMLRIAPE